MSKRGILLAILLTTAIAGPAQAALTAPQTIAAAWSNATHLDLFATDQAGQVVSTWWDGGCSWQPWFTIHPEVKMRPGAGVTAIWRSNHTHLDLFVSGTDGAVWSTWWEANPGWQPWFLIQPQVKMQPGATISALWRSNDTHLDLFATGTDGAVWSTWWEAKPGWQEWFLLHPEVKMRPGSTVSALWRSNDTHLDLFATGTDGAVWSTWWEAKPGWQKWFLLYPEVKMQPGATVTALWRSNDTHLDLFATGTDGAVWSTWWEAKPGWQKWFLLHPEVKMQPGATVTALWRSNDTHLDLFSTGTDGAVWSTWWEGTPGWQKWFLIHPEVKMQPGNTVTALWRSNDTHLDLFATGTRGEVWSTWWEASPGWQNWFSIFPDSQMQRLTDPRNVLTNLHDNARTGAYLAETALAPSNVNSANFGKLYQRQVQGQMLAQPLYLRNVNTKTQGPKNLLLAATAANMVYAFDADNMQTAPNAGLVFSRRLHNSSPLSPARRNSAVGVCPETYPPYVGVTATPVIDAALNRMYVVSFSSDDGRQYLHALDLTDGLKDAVPPVAIEPPASMISPNEARQGYRFAIYQRNRPALLLLNGVIYIGFGSFICDNPAPYAGWVFGYSEGLQQLSVWRTPKDVVGGGLWQSGRGLVGSGDGSIYFETANDDGANLTTGKLGNSFVKLRSSCGPNLAQEAAFEPSNSVMLSNGDTDLGSSGPILVGDRLIGGGKQGRVYVLNTNTMTLAQNPTSSDGFQGFQAFINTYHTNSSVQACTNLTINYSGGSRPNPDGGNADKYCRDPNSIQNGRPGYNWTEVCGSYFTLPNCYLPVSCYQLCQTFGPNIHAGFVYWQPAASYGLLYGMAEKDYLRQFRFDRGTDQMGETPLHVSQFRAPEGMPGGALSISANGTTNGIVWVSMPSAEDATGGVHRGTLLAADAVDLHELWRDDCVRYFAKFNPPVIADGKVVLATFADPTGQAVPGQSCDAAPPAIDWNTDYGALSPPLGPGTAWLIVYGLKR